MFLSHNVVPVLMTLCLLYRYLALMAALASEADWMFIPECPPEKGWEELLCQKLAQVKRKPLCTGLDELKYT